MPSVKYDYECLKCDFVMPLTAMESHRDAHLTIEKHEAAYRYPVFDTLEDMDGDWARCTICGAEIFNRNDKKQAHNAWHKRIGDLK